MAFLFLELGVLTQERLKELLHYDPETGTFTRLARIGRKTKIGEVAGGLGTHGYWQISVEGKVQLAHRLAWLYMTGEWPPKGMIVEHEDTDRSNNAFSNLRLATQMQNLHNQSLRSNNTSGLKGAVWEKRRQRWLSQIVVNKKRVFLGYFDNKEDAHAAYIKAAKKYFGDFANDGT